MSNLDQSKNSQTLWVLKVALGLLLLTTVATTLALVWYWRSRHNEHRKATTEVAATPVPDAPLESSAPRRSQAILVTRAPRSAPTFDAELTRLRNALEAARKSATNDAPGLEKRRQELAEFLYRGKRYSDAEPLYRETEQSQRTHLPLDDSGLMTTSASLARMLTDWAWAEHRAEALTTNVGLSTNPTTSTGSPAGETQKALPLDRAREAERILQDMLVKLLKGTNAAHWRTGDAKSRLGGAIMVVAVIDPALSAPTRQAKLTEAEKLLITGNDAMRGVRLAAERKYQRDALQRLVRLYESWETVATNTGKSAQAAEWKRELEAFNRQYGPGVSRASDITIE